MNTVFTTHRGLVAGTLIAMGLCLTLVSCGDSNDPKRMLQLKLYPKDAFILYISGENEMLVGDDAVNFGGAFESAYRWDVLSVDPEGNIEFNVSVKSAIYAKFQSPLGAAFEKSTFKVRMAPDGEILGLDGTDEMREKVIENLTIPYLNQAEGLSDEERASAIADAKLSLIEHLSDVSLQSIFEPLFRVWPPTPIARGDTWTRDSIPMSLHYRGTYVTTEFKVTSWEEGEVTLSTSSSLETLESDETTDLSGSTHGTVTIDAIGGFIKSVSLKKEAKGFVTLPDKQEQIPVTLREEVFAEVLRL